MRLNLSIVLVGVALAVGAFAAFVDTRPHWDDTGITAGVLFIAAAALSFVRPRFALAFAIAIGGWIPLIEIAQTRHAGPIIALGVALLGALCGAGLRVSTAPGGPSAAAGR